jgi:hypothetical protein
MFPSPRVSASASAAPSTFDRPAAKVGSSAHVDVWVQSGMGDPGTAVGKLLVKGAEIHYGRVADFFRAAVRPRVNLIVCSLSRTHTGLGGGYHYEGLWDVYVDVQLVPRTLRYRWDFSSAVFVAELCELFAERQGMGWSGEWSHGEGLSRFVAASVVPKTLDAYETTPVWWNGGAPDFVGRNSTEYRGSTIGCSVCFLYYLRWMLGFKPDRIIAAGQTGPNPTLEAVFRKLTGRQGGYAEMMVALRKRYPAGTVIPKGIASDNLFD